MKPVHVTIKKLNLRREAVRVLDAAELTLAAGGLPRQTHNQCGGTTVKVCP